MPITRFIESERENTAKWTFADRLYEQCSLHVVSVHTIVSSEWSTLLCNWVFSILYITHWLLISYKLNQIYKLSKKADCARLYHNKWSNDKAFQQCHDADSIQTKCLKAELLHHFPKYGKASSTKHIKITIYSTSAWKIKKTWDRRWGVIIMNKLELC